MANSITKMVRFFNCLVRKVKFIRKFVDHGGKHPKNRGHHSVAGEEEDLAELRNLELNSAYKFTHNIMFAIPVMILIIFA